MGMVNYNLVLGDITTQVVDAIVNAANERLAGGGGVDGAIHRAGGLSIMQECMKIGSCPTGCAVLTTAGQLKAKAVIHTVGPVWHGGNSGEDKLLASSYRSSLELAMLKGFKSVAFPSISTGVYGYPVDLAAPVAINAVRKFFKDNMACSITEVRFVLFDDFTYSAFEKALAQ